MFFTLFLENLFLMQYKHGHPIIYGFDLIRFSSSISYIETFD